MRCPKCGYISFDQVDECLKCKKNIKKATSALAGAVFNVEAPSFLRFDDEPVDDDPGEIAIDDGLDVEETFAEESDEYVDEDLDVLVAEDSEEVEIDLSGLEDETESVEEEDSDIEIDLSQFENTPDDEALAAAPESEGEAEEVSLDLPDELADISDLAPPAAEETPAAPPAPPEVPPVEEPVSQSQDAAGSLDDDLNLDDLDFDLGLDGLEEEPPAAPASSKETIMALDDIDFTETLAKDKEKGKAPAMDDDLDFELDLGDLTLPKDK